MDDFDRGDGGACAVGEQARGTRVRHQCDVRQMHDLPDAVETSRE